MRFVALVLFNLPILTICVCLPFVKRLDQALREKPSGDGLGATSYSRIAGVFGTVAITSLFWAAGNLLIWRALGSPKDLQPLVDAFSRLFMVGAALVLPYGFNQLRSMINPPGVLSTVAPAPTNTAGGTVAPAKPLASGVIAPTADNVAPIKAPISFG
jgi:hypothetical protein